MVDYIGKRSEFVSIARKYDFPKNVSLNDTPFLVKDGLAEEQAVNLRQDLRNMGMFALIMRSGAEVQQVKKRGFLAGVFARWDELKGCLIQSAVSSDYIADFLQKIQLDFIDTFVEKDYNIFRLLI